MVGEAVQFYGKIYILYPAAVRNLNLDWGEVQDAVNPRQDEQVGNNLGAPWRDGNNPNFNIPLLDDNLARPRCHISVNSNVQALSNFQILVQKMNRDKWTKKEKTVARRAFENAYKKECGEIINKIREIANNASEPDDIWRLQDFLDEKREEINIKYDYRYSVLILVFARLLKEGWITVNDLEGLEEDKIDRIRHLGGALD